MRKLPDQSFNLLLVIGGICSIATIIGLLVSAGSFGIWIVTSPFVVPAQSQQFRDFAIQAFTAILPFLGAIIATALTTNTLSEAECERSEKQARLKLSQQISQNTAGYSIAAINSLALELSDTQRRVSDLELRLNDRIDEQVRLLNRIAELEEAIQTLPQGTDFYSPGESLNSTTSDDFSEAAPRSNRPCRYLNAGSIRCAVHPYRTDCEECRDFCDP